jgi:hypothetical protein
MLLSAGDKDQADHEAQEKKRDIGELRELREGHTRHPEALSYS